MSEAPDAARAGTRAETLAVVRRAVRGTLEGSALYARADPAERRRLARGMVAVSMMAADLLAEDRRLSDAVAGRAARRPAAVATAQSAGDQLGMQAVRGASAALASARDSIDFPTYVTSLITGVFQAILTSSTQQVGAIGDLLDNVAATAEEFQSAIGDDEVLAWVAGRFGRVFTGTAEGLAVRPGVDVADHEAELASGLSATSSEVASIDAEDLEGTLLPLARRKMGRDRQSVLASMMQMGLQRIVVDEGRLHASMDLRVDAQSLSRQDLAERNDFRVNAGASASFAVGAWGASVQASTTVGSVKSDHQYTAEDIALRAGLRSSVDLAFRTEQVPLDRMADAGKRVKIDSNARVPTDVSSGSALLPTAAPSAPSFDNLPAPPDVTPQQPLDVLRAQPQRDGATRRSGDQSQTEQQSREAAQRRQQEQQRERQRGERQGEQRRGDQRQGEQRQGDQQGGEQRRDDPQRRESRQGEQPREPSRAEQRNPASAPSPPPSGDADAQREHAT